MKYNAREKGRKTERDARVATPLTTVAAQCRFRMDIAAKREGKLPTFHLLEAFLRIRRMLGLPLYIK